MEPGAPSPPPDASFDGGDLDCGNGLLLLIRRHMDPLARGQVLEVRSTDTSVEEDLPAWCRLTGNELVAWSREGRQRRYLVCKGTLAERVDAAPRPRFVPPREVVAVAAAGPLPAPAPAPALPPLAVMGLGSWPRPRWLLRALRERVEGRLDEAGFEEAADDAVRLCVQAQLAAGVDVVTDGEQRRDAYASFVAGRLDNCQLIPLTDLLPLVDDPAAFEAELRALEVPAGEVRHPAVFGPLGRRRPLAGHELAFARGLTERPVKVALPGPYLLTRTMWMECISDRAYASREALARDVVRVLREEVAHLLAGGAALVQLDEPVLTEVVFSGARGQRSFMCGALGHKLAPDVELGFAHDLLAEVTRGLPRERLALHVCRGNWSKDERVALAGDYGPLLGFLRRAPVGTVLLEAATPRAGDLEALRALPDDLRVGVGVVDQKLDAVEALPDVLARARRAVDLLGRERVLLTPDCGFATFADCPLASAEVARAKLAVVARAAAALR
ncbi:MAG: sulfurtransferase TusA family protein [Planctomycetes bacterium]|nr:sulfurtransferase TusA family protein [Planctomycetota bacterium]